MQITIQLDTDSARDLDGLAALIAAIGGRSSVGVGLADMRHDPIHVPTVQDVLTDDVGRLTPPSAGGGGFEPSVPSVDSTGLRWDERIHSNPPSTTQDGKWRKRRGVTDETLAAVTAELTDASGAAPDAPTDTAGSASEADTAVPTPPTETPAPATPDAPPPPADTASATPAATTAGNDQFANFGAFVGAVQKDKPGAVYQKLNEHAATLGVADFKSLKDRPDMWELFYDSFEG